MFFTVARNTQTANLLVGTSLLKRFAKFATTQCLKQKAKMQKFTATTKNAKILRRTYKKYSLHFYEHIRHINMLCYISFLLTYNKGGDLY